MKRITIVLMLVMIFVAGCNKNDILSEMSENMEIDVSNGTIVNDTDSHGGFHGDGLRVAQISFDDDTILEEIENSDHWSTMPLSENITALVYGIAYEEENSEKSVGPYLTDEEGKTVIPEIQNGYYYFYDRHPECKEPYEDMDVLGRGSFNFILALYDTDNKVLYYVEFDT